MTAATTHENARGYAEPISGLAPVAEMPTRVSIGLHEAEKH